MSIRESILDTARHYLGKEEIAGNAGFKDKDFERRMKEVGWQKGFAWCALFAELVWKEGYGKVNPAAVKGLDKLFSASATTTYKNFDLDANYKTSQIPQPGDVVIWRHGVGWQGHAGIVDQVNADGTFWAIEGNGNDQGGREGIKVVRKLRKLSHLVKPNDLNLVGFIQPH